MKRLVIAPLLAAGLLVGTIACGTSTASSIETLPPIRTTTTLFVSTTAPDLRERIYIVQPGDNVSEIARAYEVTAAMLIEHNNLPDDGTIQPGQELKIPNIRVDNTLPTIPGADPDDP